MAKHSKSKKNASASNPGARKHAKKKDSLLHGGESRHAKTARTEGKQSEKKGKHSEKAASKKAKQQNNTHGASHAASPNASNDARHSNPKRIPAPQEIIEIALVDTSPEEIREACEDANPFEGNLDERIHTDLPEIKKSILENAAEDDECLAVETTSRKELDKGNPVHQDKKHEASEHKPRNGKHGKDKPAHQPGKHSASKKKAQTAESPSSQGQHGTAKPKGRKRKMALKVSGGIAAIGAVVGCAMITLAVLSPNIDADSVQLGPTMPNVSGDAQATPSFLERKEIEERQKPVDSGAPEGSIESKLDQYGAFKVSQEEIKALPATKEAFSFAMDTEDFDTPELSQGSADAISSCVKSIEENNGQASYLLVDLNSGRGIAGNIDQEVYGASSFKGVFCTFLCETSEKNNTDLGWSEGPIESIVLYSDNDAYDSLRASNGSDEFGKWLSEQGIDGTGQIAEDWYPMQSARISALAWLHENDYLSSGSERSKWLNDLFQNTRVSFIRDGIGSDDVKVRNKGGWYAASYGDASEWNGTCDAGLIDCNGHTYLISVMTGAPTSDRANKDVSNLAAALWEARKDLV